VQGRETGFKNLGC